MTPHSYDSLSTAQSSRRLQKNLPTADYMWESCHSTINLFKWLPLCLRSSCGSLVIIHLICSNGSLYLSLHEWQFCHSTISLLNGSFFFSQIYMSGSLVVLLICSHGSFFLSDLHEWQSCRSINLFTWLLFSLRST